MHSRWTMAKRLFLFLCFSSISLSGGGPGASAQDDSSRIKVSVVLVQLNVAVTDRKGNYISGLRPEDFSITEDKIQEKIATFESGSEPARRLIDTPSPNSSSTNTDKTSEPVTMESDDQGTPNVR